MLKTRVGVLRGGPSTEFDVSLKTGQAVLTHLPKDRYDVRDILIDKNGVWHQRGMPVTPDRIFPHVDVLFNALHGGYGEDGQVQDLLETHGVRYTGSDRLGSRLGMRKHLAKNFLRSTGLRFAPHRVVTRDEYSDEIAREIFQSFPLPVVVKPASGGSSICTVLAGSYNDLTHAILSVFTIDDTALIEGYVRGREATVAVIDGYRGEELYVLPPIEIIPGKSSFFDYDEKYAGHAREVCPARFPRDITDELIHSARTVHRTFGLRDYSRSDFIVSREGVFFLEVNTLPGLTPASLVPKALEAVGSNLPEFLEHVVGRAFVRT